MTTNRKQTKNTMAKEKKTDEKHIQQPLTSHIEELRNRILRSLAVFIISFSCCFFYAADIYRFLAQPLYEALAQAGYEPKMIFTALPEVFFTHVKSAFFAALVIAFPYTVNQLWLFASPGLYRSEKQLVRPFLWLTPILFLSGLVFAYYVVFPLAWSFFINFQIQDSANNTLPIRLEAKVNEYLSLTMTLLFAFGMAFLLPLLLYFLACIGVIDARWLRAQRRYAIIFAFFIAAILTPPDIISQILLAIPLLFLYEISILMIRLLDKKASRDARPSVDKTKSSRP